MANKLTTIFQKIDRAMTGNWSPNGQSGLPTSPIYTGKDINHGDDIVYKTTSATDYVKSKLEPQQANWLRKTWEKTNAELSVSAYAGLSQVRLMYRDADLMDAMPEIGTALDIVSEECCTLNDDGDVIKVESTSERVKNILEDLFKNRLDVNLTAPMVIRAMCKYGNQFMLLDIDKTYGVRGWRQLPVFNMERLENGIQNPYGAIASMSINTATQNPEDTTTKFVWSSSNSGSVVFRNWQIAHFRLITNSMHLPYGTSMMNSARRAWRQLSLMEDMMLLYRLERSIERRVFKIFVGNIDDADVEAYVQEIANNFKRAPIIDPVTGQIDLRKNILAPSDDIFIPVRDINAPNPIDTLSAAQNLTALDDIKYVQNKVLTALKTPKTFINFEQQQGDGKNLALLDVRFARMLNRIQQAFLVEMTKVAAIHLYMMGFADDITNFSLSMNNPSTQAEALEAETMQKKVDIVRDAVADPGNGIPVMSLARALRTILKWSDKDIKENFEEIRLEKAIAAELEKTAQIIKRTGLFDTVDRIYGVPNAQYQEGMGADGQGGMPGGGGGGLPPAGGDFGGGLDSVGMPGGPDGDITGNEGSEPTGDMNTPSAPPPPPGNGGPELPAGPAPAPKNESRAMMRDLLAEAAKKRLDEVVNGYIETLIPEKKYKKETTFGRADIFDKSFRINEEFNAMADKIDAVLDGREEMPEKVDLPETLMMLNEEEEEKESEEEKKLDD